MCGAAARDGQGVWRASGAHAVELHLLGQVVQESLQRTRILLVAGQAFTPQHQAQVVQQVRARLGTAVQVDIEPVAEIKPEASGKYRYIVSRVALPAKEPCHA